MSKTGVYINLDSKCAQFGFSLVHNVVKNILGIDIGPLNLSELGLTNEKNKLENLITKSLGVLQENGLYAFFLYLAYRQQEKGTKEIAKEIDEQAQGLLRDENVGLLKSGSLPNGEQKYNKIRQLTEDLEKLLLARRLIEQMLIYARYHAKALGEKP